MERMDRGSLVLGRIWRSGPSADIDQRRAYGFLRLANLLKADPHRLAKALAHAYATIGAAAPDADHAACWVRGAHPIQIAATNDCCVSTS